MTFYVPVRKRNFGESTSVEALEFWSPPYDDHQESRGVSLFGYQLNYCSL